MQRTLLIVLLVFINDVDPFHSQNCRPVKVYNKETGPWTIAPFATRVIDENEELRYSYGTKEAPWRVMKFWRKAETSKQTKKQPCSRLDVVVERHRCEKEKKTVASEEETASSTSTASQRKLNKVVPMKPHQS